MCFDLSNFCNNALQWALETLQCIATAIAMRTMHCNKEWKPFFVKNTRFAVLFYGKIEKKDNKKDKVRIKEKDMQRQREKEKK